MPKRSTKRPQPPRATAHQTARLAPPVRRHQKPLIAVDVGNSETVIGLLESREVRGFWRLTSGRMTADEIVLQLDAVLRAAGVRSGGAPMGGVLCSVAPSLTLAWIEALRRRIGTAPVEVNADTARSLPIRYHDRTAVGADRIANAVAASGYYGTPAIVVDLGTAPTFDCVSQQGAYLGGAIAPGVVTSAEELFRRAARLPRVELRRPARALGRTTEESLQSGVLFGQAGQVDALVRRLALEMKGTPHVIATGGLAKIIAPECETVNSVDEALTLKGMSLLWEENT
ncbi:MAG: type III pantothenate kinase [Candidatus Eisenbacteria bacterium]|uniref:Type III pantothenate kinase n=1 Tax=Eiseniibacteriota bacterium TaxID=2212470 RepID=A0A849SP99_UNCEI|nr:type III pantothenate kinase [Candidatus Eisenbacteria bacterium]